MMNKKVNGTYIIATAGAVLFTWLIHEFTHWVTSELFGYETVMRLNGTYTVGAVKASPLSQAIISFAAPIITVLQGFVIFIFLQVKGWNKYLYPLLFSAFYMRFLAGLMNFIKVNDEGRVGQFLGIGTFTLSIIISGLLFYMVYKTSKKYELSWKFNCWTLLFILMASSIIILSDQYFRIRIL